MRRAEVRGLDPELFLEDADAGRRGDEAEERRRGVQRARAELGVGLEADEVWVICVRMWQMDGARDQPASLSVGFGASVNEAEWRDVRIVEPDDWTGYDVWLRNSPGSSRTCILSPRSSLPTKLRPFAVRRSIYAGLTSYR